MGKRARGEYLVLKDPLFEWKWVIECLCCAYRDEPNKFEDM